MWFIEHGAESQQQYKLQLVKSFVMFCCPPYPNDVAGSERHQRWIPNQSVCHKPPVSSLLGTQWWDSGSLVIPRKMFIKDALGYILGSRIETPEFREQRCGITQVLSGEEEEEGVDYSIVVGVIILQEADVGLVPCRGEILMSTW